MGTLQPEVAAARATQTTRTLLWSCGRSIGCIGVDCAVALDAGRPLTASPAVGAAWHCAVMTTSTELTLFADYFQIHVADADSDGDLSDAWTDQAVADHLAVAPDALGIGTSVNVDVSVTVDVLAQEPSDDSAEFDHVVEAGLIVSAGRLRILGCTDYGPEAATFEVPPGGNRVRVSRRNLARATQADVDSHKTPETTEKVRIQVWSNPELTARIIKRWSRSL